MVEDNDKLMKWLGYIIPAVADIPELAPRIKGFLDDLEET